MTMSREAGGVKTPDLLQNVNLFVIEQLFAFVTMVLDLQDPYTAINCR